MLAGVRAKLPNAKVTYVQGCDVLDPEPNQIAEARKAASEADAHQGVPKKLDEVLSWEAERVVQRDWTVAHEGQWYQLDK